MLWSPVPRWEQCSPRGARGAGCGSGEVSRGFPASVSAKPFLAVERVGLRAELCRESRVEHCRVGLDSAQESLEQLCCLKLCLQCSSEPRWLSFAHLHRGAGVTGVLGAGGLTLQDGSGPLAALILAKVLLLWAEPCLCSQCLEAGKLRPGLSLVIYPPSIHFSFAQCNSMPACGIDPRGPRRVPPYPLPYVQPYVKSVDTVIT